MNGFSIGRRLRVAFAPQEQNPKGEVHEDWGMFSFDKARKAIVLRQFHVEGFVNQYVLKHVAADGQEFVFETEAIENVPSGFRARTTYRVTGPEKFESIFELAPPGAEFSEYRRNRLSRKA